MKMYIHIHLKFYNFEGLSETAGIESTSGGYKQMTPGHAHARPGVYH